MRSPLGKGAKMTEEAVTIPKAAQVHTVEEVANALKAHVSTITRAIRDGRIKGIRVGKNWRIPNDEAERVIARGF